MRFLIGADVDPNPDSGAAGTVYQTCRALRTLGCDVVEVWKKELGRRIQHGNLHYLLELPFTYRCAVKRHLAIQQFDVVMLSQPHAYLAGEYIQKHHSNVVFLNRTHGWEGHADDVYDKAYPDHERDAGALRYQARRAMRAMLSRHQSRVVKAADGIVTGSLEIAAYLKVKYSYPRDRVAVLPHGVPDEFLSPVHTDYKPSRNRKLLYVGQYTPQKAPQITAAVFNRILTQYPDVEAGWVCDAAHHPIVRELILPALRHRFTLYPWMKQQELISVYDQYGLFIFPSIYEGFGKAPFEAMARGLTVISSRVGGMADLIVPGKNGQLVEPGNADEMVRFVADMLDHPDAAHDLGKNARKTAEVLRWDNMARGLISFAEKTATLKAGGKRRHD